jgi:WhiB family redox-sensing transcriptional regulator
MISLTSWQSRAACQGTVTPTGDPFFTAGSEDQALGLCRVCPVEAACLAYAISTGQTYGVWGGRRQQELRRLLAQDRQGRRLRQGPEVARHFNADKTHCKHGHPFDLANTYYTPDGRRRCRACLRAARRSWGVRRRQLAKVGGRHA